MSRYRLIRHEEPMFDNTKRPRVAIIHAEAVAAICSAPGRTGASMVLLTTGASIEIHMEPETLAGDLGIAPVNADTAK